MTETVPTPQGIPIISADPFALENLVEPHALHEQLREAGPVVYLEHYGIWGMARYEQVNAALNDWKTFSSAAGVGLSDLRKEKSWRPHTSLLLEEDPPVHTRAREVVNPVLSPRALQARRELFEREASALVDRLAPLESFDGVTQLAQTYVLKVFGDAVGIQEEGREHLLAYGDLVSNAFGPRNQWLEASMVNVTGVQQWIADNCRREVLRPGGFGAQIWESAAANKVSDEWAALLVRSLLAAGIETTVYGIVATLYALVTYADQWRALREDPSLAAAAFEEALRWWSPIQTFFRTTTCLVEIAGRQIPAGEKVLLFFGAANRDPRRWSDPHRFDIKRTTVGHVGFGMGIHRCIGLSVARVEAEVLLTTLARRVERLELAGQPHPRPNNTWRAWRSLPLTLRIST
jgi:cytochrome P450